MDQAETGHCLTDRIDRGRVDRHVRLFAGSMDTMKEAPRWRSAGSTRTSRSMTSIPTSSAPTPLLCADRPAPSLYEHMDRRHLSL